MELNLRDLSYEKEPHKLLRLYISLKESGNSLAADYLYKNLEVHYSGRFLRADPEFLINYSQNEFLGEIFEFTDKWVELGLTCKVLDHERVLYKFQDKNLSISLWLGHNKDHNCSELHISTNGSANVKAVKRSDNGKWDRGRNRFARLRPHMLEAKDAFAILGIYPSKK